MYRIPERERTWTYVQIGCRRKAPDFPLVLTALILIGSGCFFLWDFTASGGTISFKSDYARRQITFAVLGVFVMWLFSRLNYFRLRSVAFPLLAIAVGLHIVVMFSYTQSGGVFSHVFWQWPYLFITPIPGGIHLGRFTEIAAVLAFARGFTLYKKRYLINLYVAVHLAVSMTVAGFLMLSLNLRSVLVLFLTVAALLFMASAWWGIGLAILPITVFFTLIWLHPEYVSPWVESLLVWMDPFLDPSGKGFHAVQSIYAIADGGALGVGLGRGMARYVMEDIHSGFILPAVVQEIGLVGTAMILLVYLIFLARAVFIASQASDRWGFYLASAIAVRYCVMLILCLMDGMGVIPHSTYMEAYFPFFSYGGSSLVLECVLVGILLSVERNQPWSMWEEEL